MSASELARAIRDMESSAALLTRAAEALSAWDRHYDPTQDLETARELHFKALTLRVLLQTEKHERVPH